MKNKIIKYVITIIIIGCVGLFFYSYIGTDKETGVPKGLLMRIRPLPWEEIYWDEDDQLLKLTVKDETSDGKESRCLRVFELTSSGLLWGGQEYRSVDATSFINARLDYSVNDLVLIIRDKKYTEDLCHVNLEGMLEEGDSITSIEAGPVSYELGEDVVLNTTLGYRTEHHEELHDLDVPLYIIVFDPDESDIEVDNYELGKFSYIKGHLSINQKEPEANLIPAIGINGVEGYVYESDIYGEQPNTPEEAMEYMKSLNTEILVSKKEEQEYLRYIPLYKNDGVTIIGEFGISYPEE